MTTLPITRRSWADVTLAEYAACDVIRRPDAEKLLNAYYDFVHTNNPLRNAEPTRLTPEGSAWLADLHTKYAQATDEADQIAAAREFLSNMGTLLTMNVARAARGGDLR